MDICPGCGEKYDCVGRHWAYNPDHKPSFSDKQYKILEGLILGDGTLHGRSDKNCYVLCAMTTKEYLEKLQDIFGILGKPVKLKQTAAESAKAARESGFRPDAKEENYKKVYKWATRSHRETNAFESWYNGSKKTIPEKFSLSPTSLKHWYCGDGHLRNRNSHRNITLAVTNQRKNRNVVNNLFRSEGLPEPVWQERDAKNKRTELYWTKEETSELFSYMGDPLPGFEYKWSE